MKIQSLRLKNFRRFSDLNVGFDDRLTVLVGANGSGKTTVLDGVTLWLSCLQQCLDGLRKPRRIVTKDADHKIHATEPINLNGSLLLTETASGHEYSERTCSLDAKITSFASGRSMVTWAASTKEVTDLISLRLMHEDERRPVAVYYSARREADRYTPATEVATGKAEIAPCSSPQIDFAASLAWFISKYNAEAREEKQRQDFGYRLPDLSAVRHAIKTALSRDGKVDEAFGEPFVDQEERLVICRANAPEEPLSVEQLSDGCRVMMALVIDLARRMAVVNQNVKWAEGENILHSPGIAMIDEIELHLHPGWQQIVLPQLLEIFPQVQFIVTTHSPQVLSSVEQKHIRILHDDRADPVATYTCGADAARILNEVLRVSPRPAAQSAMLEDYLTRVQRGDYDSPEVLKMRQDLDQRLRYDPALSEADLYIHREQYRRMMDGKHASVN